MSREALLDRLNHPRGIAFLRLAEQHMHMLGRSKEYDRKGGPTRNNMPHVMNGGTVRPTLFTDVYDEECDMDELQPKADGARRTVSRIMGCVSGALYCLQDQVLKAAKDVSL
jgi:hypothetical protein